MPAANERFASHFVQSTSGATATGRAELKCRAKIRHPVGCKRRRRGRQSHKTSVKKFFFDMFVNPKLLSNFAVSKNSNYGYNNK